MVEAGQTAGSGEAAKVVVFRCAGDANSQLKAGDGVAVQDVAIPCTGRMQPEHLLKAFETGADAVCVIGCADGECRFGEGALRAERRIAYVRDILDAIGLGGERLMSLQLPGGDASVAALEAVAARLRSLQPSPLRGR